MTKPHPVHLALTGLLMLLSGLPLASRAGEPLIVVEDRGGTSALPYYEALNLQPRANWRLINDVVADALRGFTLASLHGDVSTPPPSPLPSPRRIQARLADT